VIDAHTHIDQYGDDLPKALDQINRLSIRSLAVSMDIPSFRETQRIAESEPLILPSRLGVALADAPPLDGDFAVESTSRRSVSDEWEQPWGEQRLVECDYNELRVELLERDEPGRRMTPSPLHIPAACTLRFAAWR